MREKDFKQLVVTANAANKELKDLVDDLYWDYDRMSSSGQETLDKMAKLLGLPTFDDVENAND